MTESFTTEAQRHRELERYPIKCDRQPTGVIASEAKQSSAIDVRRPWIASSLPLLAMTSFDGDSTCSDTILVHIVEHGADMQYLNSTSKACR